MAEEEKGGSDALTYAKYGGYVVGGVALIAGSIFAIRKAMTTGSSARVAEDQAAADKARADAAHQAQLNAIETQLNQMAEDQRVEQQQRDDSEEAITSEFRAFSNKCISCGTREGRVQSLYDAMLPRYLQAEGKNERRRRINEFRTQMESIAGWFGEDRDGCQTAKVDGEAVDGVVVTCGDIAQNFDIAQRIFPSEEQWTSGTKGR